MQRTIQPALSDNIIPFLKPETRSLNVLVVEDDRMQRAFLAESIEALGHCITGAENGAEALALLNAQRDQIDIVLMDRIMPVMDGLSAVRRMKNDQALRYIPVIMITDAAGEREMREGIEAGVFYYLAKPVSPEMLESVLNAAAREAAQMRALMAAMRRHRAGFDLLESGKFRLRTPDEAECLAGFIAPCFPEPERTVQGAAELIFNAIEHGNLEIGYAHKTQLAEEGIWRAEIERRLELPDYRDRFVEVTVGRRDEGIYLVVSDQGKGFDWQHYMMIDPARASDKNGRGIARANALSFDRLTYNAQGNQAVAFVGSRKKLAW